MSSPSAYSSLPPFRPFRVPESSSQAKGEEAGAEEPTVMDGCMGQTERKEKAEHRGGEGGSCSE